VTIIYRWMFEAMPAAHTLFASCGPALLILTAAIVWYAFTQALTQRVVASRRDRGPFLPRLAAWFSQPVWAPAAARTVELGERLGVLERIATDRAERAEVFTLPTADENAA
jgi:hypothetical protein